MTKALTTATSSITERPWLALAMSLSMSLVALQVVAGMTWASLLTPQVVLPFLASCLGNLVMLMTKRPDSAKVRATKPKAKPKVKKP